MKWVSERLDEVRRILTLLDVTRRQAFLLLLLGVVYAGFEAIGVSLLLPVLRHVERGATSTPANASVVEAMVARMADASGLPVLFVLVLIAFLPVLGRQVQSLDTLTGSVAVVTVLPATSTMATPTAGLIAAPAAPVVGCPTKASRVAAPAPDTVSAALPGTPSPSAEIVAVPPATPVARPA